MDESQLTQKISEQKPRLIYVSGKTCTGKTTFANLLEQHGYTKIELDKIVTDSVVIPFNLPPADAFLTAYRDDGPVEHTEAFISAARQDIAEKLRYSSLVIEGAIAKTRILKEIFKDGLEEFLFIYFHPVNIEVYMDRIRSRFIAGARNNTSGLPKHFWALVQDNDLAHFMDTNTLNEGIENSIKEYAGLSMQESVARLEHLKSEFPDICVVEI